MTSEEIKKVLDLHQKWINDEDGGEVADLRGVDLSEVDLRGVDLRWVDLRGVDLSGADFDYSCFPLWCGGSRFKCDTKLVYQILAHICTLDFPDDEGIKDLIMPFAVQSHRAQDLGIRDKK